MAQLKLHTPVGVSDILPEECAKKRIIEDIIEESFASLGYREVEVPTFEFYDCYVGDDGSFTQDKMFRFFDEQGNLLALRPDFTNSIARMAATKINTNLPQRYMYKGNVYRLERDHNAQQREFTQAGIELIGSYSPDADAEVIAAAINAVLATGITELNVEIGQVAFFNALTAQAELDEKNAALLRDRIDSKDCVGIQEIIDKIDIPDGIKELLTELPYMFGGREIIERADVAELNAASKAALDNLAQIYDALTDYGLEKYISIDLGMLQSIDYYTGSIFKGYTGGLGFPIFAGGRYDKMTENFGAPKGAVGVAIGIGRLLTVLGDIYNIEEEGIVLFSEKGAKKYAHTVADKLRKTQFDFVEFYIGEGGCDGAKEYTKEVYLQGGTSKLLIVKEDNSMIIYDAADGSEEEFIPTEEEAE